MLSAQFFQFFGHINLQTVRKTIACVTRKRLPGLAAEMAYSSMLALFPAVLAILTAIGLFRPLQTALRRMTDQVSEVAPVEVVTLIQDFVHDISNTRNSGLFSLSFAIALWVSSGALSAAMNALDQIHQTPHNKIRPFWKAKLISLVLTIGTILLLIVASGLVFISDLIVRRVASQSGVFEPGLLSTWRLFSWPLALGVMSIAFAFVYRFGPSLWNAGRPIFPGAILAAVSWAMISGLFRLYVSHFGHYNRAYGAVGAVIVLLLWLYMSSLVMLIGDQLNVTVGESMQQRQQRLTAQSSTASSKPSRSKAS
jgi:membrane protein